MRAIVHQLVVPSRRNQCQVLTTQLDELKHHHDKSVTMQWRQAIHSSDLIVLVQSNLLLFFSSIFSLVCTETL